MKSYLTEDTAAPTTSYAFARVTGAAATSAKHVGPQQIGLDPDLFTAFIRGDEP